jgi:hypothetical protein
MFGSGRRRQKQLEALHQRIADELRAHGPSSALTLWLRSEVDAASVRAEVFVQRHDGFVIVRPAREALTLLTRELWSEFALSDRAQWWGLSFRIAADKSSSVAYEYYDSFDARLTAHQRRRRWIALNIPSGALLEWGGV